MNKINKNVKDNHIFQMKGMVIFCVRNCCIYYGKAECIGIEAGG